MRIEPPWSPPSAMSASPVSTSTPLPADEPPQVWPLLCGFSTMPVAVVALPPSKQR